MSDPQTKAERSKAKDLRQTPAADVTPKRAPGKKERHRYLEWRIINWHKHDGSWGEWKPYWKKYTSLSVAEKAMDSMNRKHPKFDQYRIKK